MKFTIVFLGLVAFSSFLCRAGIKIEEQGDKLSLWNEKVALSFDFGKCTYQISDVSTGKVVLTDAYFSGNGWVPVSVRNQQLKEWKLSHTREQITDSLGSGVRILLYWECPGNPAIPVYLFSYKMYENNSVIVMGFGMRNNRDISLRLMKTEPLSGAVLYKGCRIEKALMLNGAAGAEAQHVIPVPDQGCESANSLMWTALVDGNRCTVVWGGLTYRDFGKWAVMRPVKGSKDNFTISFRAEDPVGRLIDPGETYWPEDNFYLDVITADPFDALEKYGRAMRVANNASPNVYDFPVLCGWSVGAMSNLPNINNSKLLVDELEAANKCGFTKYTKVAIRLEPDTYCYGDQGNTEQGWWDDEHWAKYGHLVPPYETFAGWCKTISNRNGIPYTYFQVGLPSNDYALTFPGHMLFNDISQLAVQHSHHRPLVTYDYTDPEFQKRTLTMWKRLRSEGIRGIKFDYPETGWRPEGGFENRYATTASAYRETFRLCREGLGAEAFLDERNLGESGRPCLDVTAGLVDTQRNWTDANTFVPAMVTIGGLRWYKNRTVFNYFPDTKTVHNSTKELRQSMLTMIYLTSGRIDLATSFSMFTPDIVHDFSRIYPVYREPFTARPIDAFTGVKNPQVYDLELTPDWHQVALFNAGEKKSKISFALCGDRVTEGALGLDTTKSYYIYDFWNDAYLGKMSGKDVVERELEPLHSSMLSVRKVEDNPQVLSTNRNVLQGWVELADVKWDSVGMKLTGIAKIIGGEPFRIVLANNGRKNIRIISAGSVARMESHPAGKDFTILVLERKDTKETYWEVKYK